MSIVPGRPTELQSTQTPSTPLKSSIENRLGRFRGLEKDQVSAKDSAKSLLAPARATEFRVDHDPPAGVIRTKNGQVRDREGIVACVDTPEVPVPYPSQNVRP